MRLRPPFKLLRIVLLFLALLTLTNTVQAAQNIVGCIISDAGQLDLHTEKEYREPSAWSDLGANPVSLKEATPNHWQLDFKNSKAHNTLDLLTQLGEKPILYTSNYPPDPNFTAILTQHSDSTATLEIYTLPALHQKLSIAGLHTISACDHSNACVSWDVDAHRVAFIFAASPANTLQLLLIALDTGTTRMIDLATVAANNDKLTDMPTTPPVDISWSPDGRYVTYIFNPQHKNGLLNLFGMDGSQDLAIDDNIEHELGSESPGFPSVIWATDSHSFYFMRYGGETYNSACSDICNFYWMAYRLPSHHAQFLSEVFDDYGDVSFNAARTRALIGWKDDKGDHTGVIDLKTGIKTPLIDKLPNYVFAHWTDRGFTWIEDISGPDEHLIWMNPENVNRHEVVFPGQTLDFGYAGLHPGRQIPPVFVWNNQALVVYLMPINPDSDNPPTSTVLVDLQTGKTRLLAHENYRTQALPSPQDDLFALIPNTPFNGGNAPADSGYIKLFAWDKGVGDVEIPLSPMPARVAWSPDGAQLAYTQYDTDTVTIIDRHGKLVHQYHSFNLTDGFHESFKWLPACLPADLLN